MLSSVDLFSGIGGFGLAFNSFCTPVLYCEKDVNVRRTLKKLMTDGKLHSAQIIEDVKHTDAIKALCTGKNIHLVTAGFPCVGFSTVGKRSGLKNEQTNLFFDCVSVIAALRPDMVLFENVASVLSSNHTSDLKLVVSVMHDLGYDIRWTTVSACDVGLPHRRKRWFALCYKKENVHTEIPMTDVYRSVGQEPALNHMKASRHNQRYRMLGNSIVPMAAVLAFFRMYSGFSIQTMKDLENQKTPVKFASSCVVASVPKTTQHVDVNKHGVVTYIALEEKNDDMYVSVELSQDQYLSSHKQRVSNKARSDKSTRIAEATLSIWPTPRTKCAHASHVLTSRGLRDLPTCARFARMVEGQREPCTDHDDQVNIQWIEWLMGYPSDWTV
jgi:DNA (cytosine-5)-methyltransferase 1